MSLLPAKRRKTGPDAGEYTRPISRNDLLDQDGSNSDSDSEQSSGEDVEENEQDNQVDSEEDSDDELDVSVDDLLELEKLKEVAGAKLNGSGKLKAKEGKDKAGKAPPAKESKKSKDNHVEPSKPEKASLKQSKPTNHNNSKGKEVVEAAKPAPAPPSKPSPVTAPTPRTETFADLGLGKWLTDQIAQMSIKAPSEIQKACIPPTLRGMFPFS